MSKLHPLILDPDQWRPAGWRGTDNSWTPAEVDEFHRGHVTKGWVTKKGVVVDDVVKDDKVIRKGCPENKRRQVERVAHDAMLLRDCWATPSIVWKIVEKFFGRKIACDPFWNPWGSLHPRRRLDGSKGLDGFAVDDNGKPKYWRGPVGANGPHSATARVPDVPEDSSERYLEKTGWLRLCSIYGQTEQCAAVVPQRGDDCLWHYGMSCDVVLDFGRLNFDPPPGIAATSNPGCTIVLLWLPDRTCSAPARKLFEEGSYQFPRPARTKHRRTGKRERFVLVRPGVREYDPKIDNVLKVGE